MDFSSARFSIDAIWILFGVWWLVAALESKKTKRRESVFQRLRYVLPLVVGFWLLSSPNARYSFLKDRFVPDRLAIVWLGVFLTAAGIAICFWARWHLGSNWSGVVTLKEDHELIRTGPYRTIRHPIYTGLLLALFGTAVAVGEIRGPLAVAVIWLSFYVKARREESFLSEEFGPSFADHRARTGMFLPRFS